MRKNDLAQSEQPSKPAPPETSLQPLPPDQANLIWEQWKYRHQFFWKAFYTVTVTTALISTLPLFKTDMLTNLKWFSLAFPIFGLGFGHFGRSLLEAEYKRLGVVGDAYNMTPWSYGTTKNPPYRTDVGTKVGDLLKPAMSAALYVVPIAATAAVSLVLLKPW